MQNNGFRSNSISGQRRCDRVRGRLINPAMGSSASSRRSRGRHFFFFLVFAFLAAPARVQASLFQGETLDSIANGISWVVLVLAPIIGVAAFWLVHILPEKIAEKKRHPQTKAIQCLCLLSLCFGGLLWPIAWLWAYTKPVLHKMAYGTDVDESHGAVGKHANEPDELANLRARVAELETQLRHKSAGESRAS